MLKLPLCCSTELQTLSTYHFDTPLHLAANNDHVEMWHLLITRGAVLRVTNNVGQTPLTLYEKYISPPLTPIVKQQRLDHLKAAFAGPHPLL